MHPFSYRKVLRKKGFIFYILAEFFGAFNDNVLRMVLGFQALELGWNGESSNVISSLGVSAVGAVFIVPFILFSGVAGTIADTYNKQRVLVITKSLEVVTMILALFILPLNIFLLSLALLFIDATKSTFFSPAKYGLLPEIFNEKALTRANALVSMTTYSAIIVGLFIGSILYYLFQSHKIYIALFLLGISLFGWAAVFKIPKSPYAGSGRRISLNLYKTIISGTKKIMSVPPLMATVAGIIWFWFLGGMIQLLLMLMGKETLHLNSFYIGTTLVYLGIGVAIGNLLAGRLSGERIEIGLSPLGGIGIGISSILLYFSSQSYALSIAPLFLLGISGGIFIVPLNANLQYLAGRQEKGSLIAVTNVFSMGAVLCASLALPFLHDVLGILSDTIILIFGIVTLIVTVYLTIKMPMALMRWVLWVVIHFLYRIRVRGRIHVPEKGPALLVSNHLSYVDGFLIGGALRRHVSFMLTHLIYQVSFLKPFFKLMGVICVHRGKKIAKTFEEARSALQRGELVCIFAEGAISRTGTLMPFQKGLEKIVEGLDVPIIPVHLDGIWGSVLSFDGGKYLWKRPKRFPYPVTVSFGRPLSSEASKDEVREAVKELEADVLPLRKTVNTTLPLRFIKSAKSAFWRLSMVDSTGAKLHYGKLLMTSLILAQKLRRQTEGENNIGIVLPASIGGCIANLAVGLAGKVCVNLNFTLSKSTLEHCVKQAQIKTFITSRLFIKKIGMKEREGMIFLEDLKKTITFGDCIKVFFLCFLPSKKVLKIVSKKTVKPSSVATIIFSSGSTGIPKGVMLSHKNILANIEGCSQGIPFNKREQVMGSLPFFHAFGYTVLFWLPLIRKFLAIYHSDPRDAKTIGKMVMKYEATYIVATPSFYELYVRGCESQQFRSLRMAISGAEKLRPSTLDRFKDKFGMPIYEGYGLTELSPVVSVNIPDITAPDGWRQIGHKPGTVGSAIPGVATKIVDPETMKDLPLGVSGMLLVRGASTMVGYLDQPEATKKSFYGPWYITHDIAKMDEGGFITIMDRISRFSKIGGEMVPHMIIEDKINEVLGGPHSIVTTVTSQRKGEELAVLFTHETITEKFLWEQLRSSELSNLWLPKLNAFIKSPELPVTATGKFDLVQARKIAESHLEC